MKAESLQAATCGMEIHHPRFMYNPILENSIINVWAYVFIPTRQLRKVTQAI